MFKRLAFLIALICFVEVSTAKAVSRDDAIAITSAPTGRVLSVTTLNYANLTAPQRTALVSFLVSLGIPAGSAPAVLNVTVGRVDGQPNIINASVQGILSYTDAALAITNVSAKGEFIVGIVP